MKSNIDLVRLMQGQFFSWTQGTELLGEALPVHSLTQYIWLIHHGARLAKKVEDNEYTIGPLKAVVFL